MGAGDARRQVDEEGRRLGRDAEAVECGAGTLHVLGAHLLGELQPRAQVRRQERQRGRHGVGEEARALAAAEHQKPEFAARDRRVVGDRRRLDHHVAHRIAGMHRLGGEGLGVARRREGERDAGRPPGEAAIGAPHHGILVVQHGRTPEKRAARTVG